MTQSEDILYTIREVADKKLLGYSAHSIRNLIEKGELGFYEMKKSSSNYKGTGEIKTRNSMRIGLSHIKKFLDDRNQAKV